MSEENIEQSTAVDSSELDALKRSIEGLEKKNFELIGKLKMKERLNNQAIMKSLLNLKGKQNKRN